MMTITTKVLDTLLAFSDTRCDFGTQFVTSPGVLNPRCEFPLALETNPGLIFLLFVWFAQIIDRRMRSNVVHQASGVSRDVAPQE